MRLGKSKKKYRVLIRSVDIGTEGDPHDRGPVDPPIAVIRNPSNLGASKYLNSPGEMFFTLPSDDPQASFIEPFLTHMTIEQHRDGGWVEVQAGLVVDFSSQPNETVFYGLDYLGLLSKLYDERFSDKGPNTSIANGGAKYSSTNISAIIQDQLENARDGEFSPVAFIDVPTLAAWDETITIISTFKERLGFILGLMESHGASTGRKPRIKCVRLANGTYQWQVTEDGGVERDDMRFTYGGLAQGYEVVPFGDFSTRVFAVGTTPTGIMPMYAEAYPVDDGGGDPFPEWYWGRWPTVAAWQDIIDKNDLKRRALRLARQVGKVGKQVGIGIRVDSIDPEDGWDITDEVPIDIDDGTANTLGYGSGYYIIAGWQLMLFPDGHTDLILTFVPRPDGVAVDLTIIEPDEVNVPPDPVLSTFVKVCHPTWLTAGCNPLYMTEGVSVTDWGDAWAFYENTSGIGFPTLGPEVVTFPTGYGASVDGDIGSIFIDDQLVIDPQDVPVIVGDIGDAASATVWEMVLDMALLSKSVLPESADEQMYVFCGSTIIALTRTFNGFLDVGQVDFYVYEYGSVVYLDTLVSGDAASAAVAQTVQVRLVSSGPDAGVWLDGTNVWPTTSGIASLWVWGQNASNDAYPDPMAATFGIQLRYGDACDVTISMLDPDEVCTTPWPGQLVEFDELGFGDGSANRTTTYPYRHGSLQAWVDQLPQESVEDSPVAGTFHLTFVPLADEFTHASYIAGDT